MSKDPSQPIRPDIDKLLRAAYPQGAMAPAFDIQTSHLAEVFPRLKTRLEALGGAEIAYERDPLGGEGWAAGDGRLPSGPPPTHPGDPPSSYYLFFLAATDESCRLSPGDSLKVGYTVALSVMAPLALVVLNHMEEDDDGFSHSMPEIAPELVDLDDGGEMEVGRFCREELPTGAPEALELSRGQIAAVLEELGFCLLPVEEQAKPIPWLEVPAMPFRRPARLAVRDALFFYAM